MPPKKAASAKKSVETVVDSASGSDTEEAPAPKSPSAAPAKKLTGLQKPLKLSAELCKLLKLSKGEEMSRPQVVKHLWAYLKEHKLQDPENKQWFTPDKAMEGIFGKEKIKAFGMTKYLKGHIGVE